MLGQVGDEDVKTLTLGTLVLAFSGTSCTAQVPETPAPPTPTSGYSDILYGLARRAEGEALSHAASLLQDAVREHDKDLASFSLHAHRFGDFLLIEEARGGQKYASAVNLQRVEKIELTEGHGPDMGGSVDYYAVQVPDKEATGSGSVILSGRDGDVCDFDRAPTRGRHWEVKTVLPTVPKSRLLVQEPQYCQTMAPTGASTSGGMWIQGTSTQIVRCNYSSVGGFYLANQCPYHGVTTPFMRPAEDDEIKLTGLDYVIYVPAGKGPKVRDAILNEIRTGWINQFPTTSGSILQGTSMSNNP